MESTEDGKTWGPPFSKQEFAERIVRVKAEMARRNVDLLYVSSPPNLTYLTGYDTIWYSRTNPIGLAVPASSDTPIFFDSVSHGDLVRSGTGRFEEVVFFDRRRHAPAIRTIVDTLKARGWLKGTVGVERWSRSFSSVVMNEFEAALSEAGGRTLDGSWLVDRVRMNLSPAEIECVRNAAGIADAGMVAVREALRPGLTEIEIQATAHYAMGKMGGEEPAIRTAVRTGPRGAAHHVPPSRRKVELGDIVYIDYCGSFNRYHVDLGRVFSLGEPDPRWKRLFDTAAESIHAVVEGMRPGDPMRKVHDIGNAFIDQAGLREFAWLVGGYDIGLAIPPDWVGHTFHSGLGFEEVDFEVGMLTNYENCFDIVTQDWPGGRGASYVDSILMTEQGLEILSKLDRRIVVV